MGEAAWGCWACWVGVGQTGLHRRQNGKESLSRAGATRLAQPLPLFSTSGVVSREGKSKGGEKNNLGTATSLTLAAVCIWTGIWGAGRSPWLGCRACGCMGRRVD